VLSGRNRRRFPAGILGISTTGRMTLTTATKGRRVRWEDSPREDLMAGVQRRFLYGEKAMLAQIWLKKGTSVPRHVHPAEQLSFIVEGALRLRLGDDLSEVHDVRAGEVLVIPANVPHEATALEDTYDLDVFSPPREDWIKGQDAYLRGR
jgi:quercetin dioxygenase-like cupin family protein